MGTKSTSQKKQDYDAAMAATTSGRSAITASADPFAETALSQYLEEIDILAELSVSWKMNFCQATMGFVRRAGGLWIAYTPDGQAKSVLHVERFIGKASDWPQINFWAEHVRTGQEVAQRYNLPFAIVVQFNDGRYALRFDKDHVEETTTIGSRLAKGVDYPATVNMVSYFDIALFTKISKGGTSAE